MEPADERPDDWQTVTRLLAGIAAAMEPADERPDDVISSLLDEVRSSRPQWSRPMNGRMTASPHASATMPAEPQWSRPMNGRMTRSTGHLPVPGKGRNGAGR